MALACVPLQPSLRHGPAESPAEGLLPDKPAFDGLGAAGLETALHGPGVAREAGGAVQDVAKAHWWWERVHRFWVAVPAKIAASVAADLPTGWGLLSCSGAGAKVLVKAVKHEAKPLAETTYLGLLRAASGVGLNALQRARDAGFAEGERRGPAPRIGPP